MANPDETRSYPVERLGEFAARAFRHFGVPEADAQQAAEVLMTSDLRGIDSHGVTRLHTDFDMLTLGRINPDPRVRVFRAARPPGAGHPLPANPRRPRARGRGHPTRLGDPPRPGRRG